MKVVLFFSYWSSVQTSWSSIRTIELVYKPPLCVHHYHIVSTPPSLSSGNGALFVSISHKFSSSLLKSSFVGQENRGRAMQDTGNSYLFAIYMYDFTMLCCVTRFPTAWR